MSLLRVTLALIALIALFSASSQAGKTADVAVESCLQDLNLSAVACACIGRRAEEELNEKQQKYFLSAIKNDTQAQAALRGGMTSNEMTQVSMFMTSAPRQCAGQ